MKSAVAASAVLFAISLVASGCALSEDKPPSEARASREYRTGSNIPVKEPSAPATAEERERAMDQIRQLQLRTGINPPQP
jgi:hypothetical protein